MDISKVTRSIFLAISIFVTAVLAPAALPQQTAAATAQPAPAVHGSQPFLFILCKLADETNEPETPAFFEDMLLGSEPSLDGYWQEVSSGLIDLAGSGVAGWYTMPEAAASFKTSQGVDRDRLALACMDLAKADHNLNSYAGLGLVYNVNLESQPWAGQACPNGECHKVIWMWPQMLRNHATWAHEMGHVFGLTHSSDATNQPYANVWDVMSGATGCTDGKKMGAVAQHPIADQIDRLGWIPEGQKLVAAQDAVTSVELQALGEVSGAGKFMVQVPVSGANRYYTIEARMRNGYDEHTPGEAVLIHSVDPSDAAHPAHLVSHPGAPLNAVAGMWRPGEVFSDATTRINISVDGRTNSGFRVTIRTGSTFEDRSVVLSSALPKIAAAATTARDTAGRVYKVREERNGRDWDIYVTETTADGTTISDRRINDDTGKTWQGSPAIAADVAGNVTVVWVDRRSGASEIYAATRTNEGNWAANVRLAKAGIDTYSSPSLAVDVDGHVTATWMASPACGRAKGLTGTIMAAELAGGEWQAVSAASH